MIDEGRAIDWSEYVLIARCAGRSEARRVRREWLAERGLTDDDLSPLSTLVLHARTAGGGQRTTLWVKHSLLRPDEEPPIPDDEPQYPWTLVDSVVGDDAAILRDRLWAAHPWLDGLPDVAIWLDHPGDVPATPTMHVLVRADHLPQRSTEA